LDSQRRASRNSSADEGNHALVQHRYALSYVSTLEGMRWLRDNNFQMAVAGRTIWGDTEATSRDGYAALFAKEGFRIDAKNPGETILFPEMDETAEVPEITTACWGILNKSPRDVMCASSRMVVKRKGAAAPVVLACTLLPYDSQFEFGATLAAAEATVKLNPLTSVYCDLYQRHFSCFH